MVPYRPEQILVQRDSWQDSTTLEILARLPGVPVRTIEDVESVLPQLNRSSDAHASGKHCLILARHLGRFLKGCPGAGAEICCNYFVVNLASNCHLECTYCFLQAYLNNPALVVYTNVDDLLEEVRLKVVSAPDRMFRIGTGEISDSLALDGITRYSRRLVPSFGSLSNVVLELKTKSDHVANLEGLEHRGRTIVSWSMNSRRITREEELKTASFEERLNAARRCQGWGYTVGFHFDPLIHYPGWERDYREAVEELFHAVDPSRIAWVSLGSLRFTGHLREIVRARFPRSRIPNGEFVPGNHGKLRYFRPIREEMYARMREWIHRAAPNVFVYLCMENRAAWENSFEVVPRNTEDLSDQMDTLVRISS